MKKSCKLLGMDLMVAEIIQLLQSYERKRKIFKWRFLPRNGILNQQNL